MATRSAGAACARGDSTSIIAITAAQRRRHEQASGTDEIGTSSVCEAGAELARRVGPRSISDRFLAAANVSPGFSPGPPFRGHGRARPRALDRPLGLPPVPGVQLRPAVLVAQG